LSKQKKKLPNKRIEIKFDRKKKKNKGEWNWNVKSFMI
jgi:hypothetical protein